MGGGPRVRVHVPPVKPSREGAEPEKVKAFNGLQEAQ